MMIHSNSRIINIRNEYTFSRIKELKISVQNPYYPMIFDENIIDNFAAEIKDNSRFIQLVDADTDWLEHYDGLIFESGQGLLLDRDYTLYTFLYICFIQIYKAWE